MKPKYRVKKRKKLKKRRITTPAKRMKWFNKILMSIGIAYLVVLVYLVGMIFLAKADQGSDIIVDLQEQNQDISNVTRDFILEIAPIAKEMQRNHQVLPSVIIGQAILESDSGRSELGRDYHNLFGIKAYGNVEQIELATKEFIDGQWLEVKSNFRVYESWADSINDHTQLFISGVTWNHDLYRPVVEAPNYREAARALQQAGYATDPNYGEKLVSVIESYKLYAYD